MSGIDPFNPFGPDAAAATATEPRAPGASPAWKRELERAQWAALGEHFDRSSPTSAAEPRLHDRQAALEAARPSPSPCSPSPLGEGRGEGNGRGEGGDTDSLPVPLGESRAEGRLAPSPVGEGSRGIVAAGASRLIGTTSTESFARSTIASGSRPAAAFDAAPFGTAHATAALHRALEETMRDVLEGSTGQGAAAGLESETAELVAPEAAPLPGHETGESPAPRAMHVFTSDEGAQVFIRDAALDPAALPGLVARIAAELALGGTRLAALTINGRGVFDAAAETASPHAAAAVPQRTTDKTQGR